ncbi:GerAB/ArcD/ProY family transporter [Neobacillus muris]|uniref:GerAB/ArcD/ProY family transporter n=1 Tax=Neobacillus muris TaxID=2941334 RepID=UPI00203DFF87|nr:endospore germination permease [Neobacillus muris]
MVTVKISKIQALMLGISSVTVTGHLFYIPVIIYYAGRDSWISLLLATIPAILIGFTISFLAQRFKGQTLVEYSQLILGKWAGKLLAIIFLGYFFHEITLDIRGFGEFYTSAITPQTPILIYMTAIFIMAVYAVRSGLEVLARTNQAFLLFLIPIGVLASILTQKDKDYKNFLPVMNNGWDSILLGTLSITAVYCSIFVLSMILSDVSSAKHLKKYTVMAMVIQTAMFIGPVTGVIAVFGEERAVGMYFPTFQLLRDIEIGTLERLDVIGVLLWSLGSFAKVSLLLYALAVGVAQLFKIDDYTIFVLPIAALIVIVSFLNSEDFIGIYRFERDIYPYYSTLVGLVLPLILLIVSLFRKNISPIKGEHH